MSKSIHEITKESWLKATFPEWGTYFRQLCFKERLHSGGLVVQAFG